MNNRVIAVAVIVVLLILGVLGWMAYNNGKNSDTNAPAANTPAANAPAANQPAVNVNAGLKVNSGTSGSTKTGGNANAPLPTKTGGEINGNIGQPMY